MKEDHLCLPDVSIKEERGTSFSVRRFSLGLQFTPMILEAIIALTCDVSSRAVNQR